MQGTAGAGSLILEFGTLSRLTGDERFERAAYKAFFALWNQRSDVGLVGNTVNIWSGVGCHPYSLLSSDQPRLRLGCTPKSAASEQVSILSMNMP